MQKASIRFISQKSSIGSLLEPYLIEIWKWAAIRSSSVETFSLRKNFSPKKLDKKVVFYAVKTIIYFRKNMMFNHHFIIKMNKRLDARMRKPNYESSLVDNILPN